MAPPIDKSIKTSTGVALFLLLLVFLCFHKSLWCYFTADDFWHLSRLHEAVNGNPHLLFENFWKPWVDKTLIYKFYRPFTEISLAFDYLLWGNNPFGYHLSNLVYHWINSFLVYLTLQKVLLNFLKSDNSNEQYKGSYYVLAPFFTAALFATHPINTEPVTWIASRADLVGTLFYLSTIYFYLLFIQAEKNRYKMLSIIALILGLLSKEICATAPLIISLICATKIWNVNLRTKDVLIRTLVHTKFYWLITLVYLVVRSLSLKSFFGGYVGSVAYMLNSSIIERLTIPQTVWKIIYPINNQMPELTFAPDFFLRALYLFTGLLLIINVLSHSIKSRKNIILGCILWSLIIVGISVQVWSVNDNLSGGRLIYLLLFPLLTSFTLLIFTPPLLKSNTLLMKLDSILLSLFVVVFILTSNSNTQAWLLSSLEIKALKKDIETTLSKVPQSKRIAVYNIPPYILGTVAFCNTDYLEGFLSIPLCKKNYYPRVLAADGSLIPTSLINDFNISDFIKRKNIILYRWNRQSKKLNPVEATSAKEPASINLLPLRVKHLGSFKQVRKRLRSTPDKLFSNTNPGSEITSYLVTVPEQKTVPSQYSLLLKISCLSNNPNRVELSKTKKVNISWGSFRKCNEDENKPFTLHVQDTAGTKWYRFPFFDFKLWIGETTPELIRIDLPGSNVKLVDCLMEKKSSVKPSIDITSDYNYLTNGIIKPRRDFISIKYNVEKIPQASKIVYEISEPNCQFELYTSPSKAPFLIKDFKKGVLGEIKVTRSQLKEKRSFYQLRLRALNKENKMLGVYSSPVAFSFDL